MDKSNIDRQIDKYVCISLKILSKDITRVLRAAEWEAMQFGEFGAIP